MKGIARPKSWLTHASQLPLSSRLALVAGGELEGPGLEGSGALQDELVAHRQYIDNGESAARPMGYTTRPGAGFVVHGTSMLSALLKLAC